MSNAVAGGGGSVFKITPLEQLDRFLILGSYGNQYRSDAKLARDNARNVISLLRTDPKLVIDRIVEISDSGRAPKNDFALFALALAASDSNAETRRMALDALPKVARTGTHLFDFVAYAEQFRGWGKAMRRAIANWYLNRDTDNLAYQVVKYQSRNGWSNRDLLRLAHPKAPNEEFEAIFRWINEGASGLTAGEHTYGSKSNPKIAKRKDVTHAVPAIINAFEEAKTAGENRLISLILDHNLPREAVPTTHLNSPRVWEALLDKMPMTAMIRNLATMTRVGLLTPGSKAEQKIIDELTNAERLKRARVHPITIMAALYTYRAGRGVRGKNTWNPVYKIVDALDDAFYAAFGNVTPTNKPTLIGLDVSGSMALDMVNGFVNLSARDVSAAMALITARTESDYRVVAFSRDGWTYGKPSNSWNQGSIVDLDITPRMKLGNVIDKIRNLPFSGTDVSLPMLWALHMGYAAENFSVYTDSETYEYAMTAKAALTKYRKETGIPAKLAVFGTTAHDFSIADPNDPGMMDFVGFDTNAPELAAQFFAK